MKELYFFCSLELNHDHPALNTHAHTHVGRAVSSLTHQPNQPPQCCLGDWVGISHSLVAVFPDGQFDDWVYVPYTNASAVLFLTFQMSPIKLQNLFLDAAETT